MTTWIHIQFWHVIFIKLITINTMDTSLFHLTKWMECVMLHSIFMCNFVFSSDWLQAELRPGYSQ